MDLALKDLGQTLAVGVFTVFGLVYLATLCKRSWKARISVILTSSHKLYLSGMILALVFAVGVLVEDVSKNYTAERVDDSVIFNISSTIFNFVVDTDKELRLRSLFVVHDSSDNYIELSHTPIYDSLMAVSHKDQIFIMHKNSLTNIPTSPCISEKEEETCKRVNDKTEMKKQANATNQIYYDAKNRVYHENTYFTELQEIEKRVNFARSLTFLCLIYSLLFSVVAILCWLPWKWKFISTVRKKRKFIVLIFGIYVLGILLARISFRSETINYNLRVFGYYISITSGINDSSTESNLPPAKIIPIH